MWGLPGTTIKVGFMSALERGGKRIELRRAVESRTFGPDAVEPDELTEVAFHEDHVRIDDALAKDGGVYVVEVYRERQRVATRRVRFETGETPLPPAPARVPVPAPAAAPVYAYVLEGIGVVVAPEAIVKTRPHCQWTGGGPRPCPGAPPGKIVGVLGGPYASEQAAKADLKTKLDCFNGYWGAFINHGPGTAWLQNNVTTADCRTVKQL
jgi:hypothetical protein